MPPPMVFSPTSTSALLAEIITGMKFTYDCRHLITVSGDRWARLPLGLWVRNSPHACWEPRVQTCHLYFLLSLIRSSQREVTPWKLMGENQGRQDSYGTSDIPSSPSPSPRFFHTATSLRSRGLQNRLRFAGYSGLLPECQMSRLGSPSVRLCTWCSPGGPGIGEGPDCGDQVTPIQLDGFSNHTLSPFSYSWSL